MGGSGATGGGELDLGLVKEALGTERGQASVCALAYPGLRGRAQLVEAPAEVA